MEIDCIKKTTKNKILLNDLFHYILMYVFSPPALYIEDFTKTNIKILIKITFHLTPYMEIPT